MIAILILIISMIMIGQLIKLKKEVRRLKKQTTIIMKEIKILKKT